MLQYFPQNNMFKYFSFDLGFDVTVLANVIYLPIEIKEWL